MNFKKYFDELKRRQVIKVGIAYLVVAWLIIQVSAIVLPTFNAPPFLLKTVLYLIGVGFPISLILSWIYEITPNGIKQTKTVDPSLPKSLQKSQRLNRVIIAALSLVVILLFYNQFNSKSENSVVSDSSNLVTTKIGLAVLAFEDMSPEKDQEYFSDGMSTELTTILSKMPDLSVRDRRSAFSYKGVNATIQTIAKELNVTHIIDGSVRKIGNDVRIDVQLIDALNGTSIWAHRFNRKMGNIFQLQDDIASNVREQLKLNLLSDKMEIAAVNSEAYSLYLQADFINYNQDSETQLDAIPLLRESIKIDSTFAPAFTLLATTLFNATVNRQEIAFDKGLDESRLAIEKAISLDRNLGQAYAILALIDLTQNRDFKFANFNIEKALQIEPNNASILANACIVKGYSGNLDNLVEDHSKFLKISPKTYPLYLNKGIVQHWTGDLNGALKSYEKLFYYHPSASVGHFMMAKIYLEKGDYKMALEVAEKEPVDFMRHFAKSLALHGMDRLRESKASFENLLDILDENSKANIAEYYAYKKDVENVFKYLNLAYDLSDPDLIEIINFPVFKIVYDDPRWESLLYKMNLPESHHLFKKINSKK